MRSFEKIKGGAPPTRAIALYYRAPHRRTYSTSKFSSFQGSIIVMRSTSKSSWNLYKQAGLWPSSFGGRVLQFLGARKKLSTPQLAGWDLSFKRCPVPLDRFNGRLSESFRPRLMFACAGQCRYLNAQRVPIVPPEPFSF